MTPRPTTKPDVTFARAVAARLSRSSGTSGGVKPSLSFIVPKRSSSFARRRPAGVDVFPAVQEREGLPVIPAAGGPLLALEHVPEAVGATDGDLEHPGELNLLAGRQGASFVTSARKVKLFAPSMRSRAAVRIRAASGSIGGFSCARAAGMLAMAARARAGGEKRPSFSCRSIDSSSSGTAASRLPDLRKRHDAGPGDGTPLSK